MTKRGYLQRVKQFFKRKGYGPGNDYWYGPVQAPTKAGVDIDEVAALNFSAVWNAIQIISGTIGSLPLHLLRRAGKNTEKMTSESIYGVLHSVANPEMSAMSYREATGAHVVSWGNSYTEIVRSKTGEVVELWPIGPNRVKPERKNDKMFYEISIGGGQKVTLPREKVLHIPGLGFDGLMGYSVLNKARESIALGMATEEFGSRYFGGGTHPGVVVSHPLALGPDAHKRLKKDLTNAYSGLGKSHKLLLLEEGMKMENIGIPPEDSQFLQTRQFQTVEVARWFNIDPSKLKDHSRSTFNNIEHLSIMHVVDCITPWMVRIEQCLDMQLLTPEQRQLGFFFKHNVEGLLRGDTAARAEFYSKMFNIGAYSINEIREKENMNPVDGGDERFVPLNMVPLSMAKEVAAPKPEPEPAQIVAPEPDEETDEDRRGYWKRERQYRSIQGRDRLIKSYYDLFKTAAQRIVSKEALRTKKLAKEHGSTEFVNKMHDFYLNTMPGYIKKEMNPVITSFAGEIGAEASKEIGADFEQDDEFNDFVTGYSTRFIERHIESSVGQLESIAKEKRAIDPEPDPFVEDVDQRVDEWTDTRPDKIALNETNRLANGMAQFVFFAGGFSLVWRTRGGKSCPYCKELNGRKISKGESFIDAGTMWEPEGAKNGPMKIRGMKTQPPLHQGCRCYVGSI